jgi:hypothetical protein
MTDETKEVQVILGPYRDSRLTMSTADAEAAINAHWAVDPFAPLDEHPHDPLTEQQRQDAYEASMTWAQAQWGESEPKDASKDHPEMHKREMKPQQHEGGYETREVKPSQSTSHLTKPR